MATCQSYKLFSSTRAILNPSTGSSCRLRSSLAKAFAELAIGSAMATHREMWRSPYCLARHFIFIFFIFYWIIIAVNDVIICLYLVKSIAKRYRTTKTEAALQCIGVDVKSQIGRRTPALLPCVKLNSDFRSNSALFGGDICLTFGIE